MRIEKMMIGDMGYGSSPIKISSGSVLNKSALYRKKVWLATDD
jgi:hypothetical protein